MNESVMRCGNFGLCWCGHKAPGVFPDESQYHLKRTRETNTHAPKKHSCEIRRKYTSYIIKSESTKILSNLRITLCTTAHHPQSIRYHLCSKCFTPVLNITLEPISPPLRLASIVIPRLNPHRNREGARFLNLATSALRMTLTRVRPVGKC